MGERRGEKLGWIGGWLGGFVWVVILSVVFLVQGRPIPGTIGLLIAGAACATVLWTAPWRHPRTRLRALMLPVYLLFFASVAWGIVSMGDPRRMGFNSWWSLLLLLPVFIPLWTAGDRRWEDGDA